MLCILCLQNKQVSFVINAVARVVSTADRTVECHDRGDRSVDLLGGLFLVGLDVARRITLDENVVHVPAQHWMPVVGDLLLQRQLHQLFGRRRHITVALTELHQREAQPFKVLRHLHSTPAVEGDLPDVKPCPQLVDEVFDEAVVNDVALSRQQVALPFPEVVLVMVLGNDMFTKN